jgi:hypothetical protein
MSAIIRLCIRGGKETSNVQRNTEARSRNHCCSGKAKCIIFSVSDGSLSYPACTAHAPNCHLWPVRLCRVFQHHLIKGSIIRKESYSAHQVCFDSLYNFWNIYNSKKNSVKYCHKCTYVCMSSTLYSCHIVMKLEFSQQIFEKCSNIWFHENPSTGNPAIPYKQMDGRTDMTKLIVAFRNSANAPKRHLQLQFIVDISNFNAYSSNET